ncbi:hypothetical protein [Promicromonospora sp. NPDC050249]|uniref:hypothetical protein n=1 Tax=Promicromonospora sp. NPDC050249 TaxID=3154743 RepID=UPI0033E6750D
MSEVQPDDVEAVRDRYLKAALSGDSDAMFRLAELEESAGDLPAARQWFERAAADGNRDAVTRLGLLQERVNETDYVPGSYHGSAIFNDLNNPRAFSEPREQSGRTSSSARSDDSSSAFEPTARLDPDSQVPRGTGPSEVGSATTDSATTTDTIGIGGEVDRLARVLCAHATSLPG